MVLTWVSKPTTKYHPEAVAEPISARNLLPWHDMLRWGAKKHCFCLFVYIQDLNLYMPWVSGG